MSVELIDKQKIFEKLKHTMPECGKDNSKERYRYMQWLADNNAIKELPTVKAIPIEVVEQILSEISEEIGTKQWEDYDYCSGLITAKRIVEKYREQEPKTGHWIEYFDESGKWYECDQCHTDWGGAVNYCPNCGAKMDSEVVEDG